MFKEDNNGFINFPLPGKFVNKHEGKTFVYLVAFETSDILNNETVNAPYALSNLRLLLPGDFVSDDISARNKIQNMNISLDELVKIEKENIELDKTFFPNEVNPFSIPLTSAICIGWHDSTFEIKNDIGFWHATFRDLTHEGKKLYYSIKKLHNNKQVRILTFNNI